MAFLAGPVFGVAAAGWTRAIRWTTDHRAHGWRLLVVPVAVFAGLGGASIAYPQVLGNGRSIVQDSFDHQQALGLLAALLVLKPLVTVACLTQRRLRRFFPPRR